MRVNTTGKRGAIACLVAMAACHSGMSARQDGATDGVATGKDVVSREDGPAPDLPRDTLSVEVARDQGTSDSALDLHPRDAGTTDANDANGDSVDGILDAADPVEAAPKDATGLDLAADVSGMAKDARPDVPAVDTGLAAFCTGDLARLSTNGNNTGPAIHPSILAMDCCEGFELEIITATFTYGIYVSWAVPARAGALPLDVDLSDPSRLQWFEVATRCDSTRANCADSYRSGFVGRLQLSRVVDGGYAYEASLCVHVEETAANPRSSLHSFDLYVPRIVIR